MCFKLCVRATPTAQFNYSESEQQQLIRCPEVPPLMLQWLSQATVLPHAPPVLTRRSIQVHGTESSQYVQ
jgi:hypothetical protein